MNRLELMNLTEVADALRMSKDQVRAEINELVPDGCIASERQQFGFELMPLHRSSIPLPVAIDAYLQILYWRRSDIASHLDMVKVQRVVAGVDVEEAALREMRRDGGAA